MEKLEDNRFQVRVINITPELAKRWLAISRVNRKINNNRVNYYAMAMRKGEWELTHQGVCFDDGNNLIDGQHRLSAIVASGVTVQMLVTTGMKSGAQRSMDSGQKRTLSHVFKMEGINDSSTVSAAVTKYFTIKNSKTVTGSSISVIEKGITPIEMVNFYHENTDKCINGASFGRRMYAYARWFTKSEYAGYYLYLVIDKKYPEEIIKKYISAVTKGFSTYHNANILFSLLSREASKSRKIQSSHKRFLLTKAFNADCIREEKRQIKYVESEGFIDFMPYNYFDCLL